jgi:hypothetical protein
MVTAISSPGSADALASLLGSSVSTGFRRVLAASVPELPRDQLLYRMLHDLPGTSLVGGMVIVRGGASPFSAADLLVMENVCRGWRTGGSQLEEVDAGRIPMPTGPFPTSLDDPADPLAWHDTEAPGRDIVRRGRRMDIWRSGDELRVDLHYRDTFHSSDQPTMVVHEYSLRASAAASDGEVRTITTEAHALPWVDCNTVPSSSESVIGARLGAIHVAVREQLRGAAGCTHLNDTLRELDTVPALALALGVGS